jgi:hypothetical protein
MLAIRAMRATVQRMCMKNLPVCQPAASAGAAGAANATLQPRNGTVKQGIAWAKAPRQAPRQAPYHALAARRDIGQQWFSSAATGMVDVSAEERAAAAVKITDVCAKRILKVLRILFTTLYQYTSIYTHARTHTHTHTHTCTHTHTHTHTRTIGGDSLCV